MTSAKAGRGTILVVDNDPDVGLVMTAIFEDRGFGVVFASDAESGLAAARERRPMLICLDANVQRRSGVSVYRALKQDPELQRVPVVMVSGWPPPVDTPRSRRVRMPPPEAVVTKPLLPQLLVAAVEKVLRSRFSIN